MSVTSITLLGSEVGEHQSDPGENQTKNHEREGEDEPRREVQSVLRAINPAM